MKTSEKGAAFIAAHEGVVTRTYRAAAGVLTIGVGHTAVAGPPRPARGMAISRDEAFAILKRDLEQCEARVARRLPNASQTVFDGAVSFDFNTGAIDRASWVAAFVAGDRDLARTGLMLWVKAGGRPLAGLVKRRTAEAKLIFDGDYGEGKTPDPTSTVRRLQADLAQLGFYDGKQDGIAGRKTRAAVIAYQRSHGDLLVDGVAGQATKASLARDIALRRGAAGGVTAAIGAVVAGGAVGDGHWAVVAALAGLGALIVAAAILIHRYGGEVARAIGMKGQKP